MNPFKRGESVQCMTASTVLEYEKIYTVLTIDEEGIRLSECSGWWNHEFFRPYFGPEIGANALTFLKGKIETYYEAVFKLSQRSDDAAPEHLAISILEDMLKEVYGLKVVRTIDFVAETENE